MNRGLTVRIRAAVTSDQGRRAATGLIHYPGDRAWWRASGHPGRRAAGPRPQPPSADRLVITTVAHFGQRAGHGQAEPAGSAGDQARVPSRPCCCLSVPPHHIIGCAGDRRTARPVAGGYRLRPSGALRDAAGHGRPARLHPAGLPGRTAGPGCTRSACTARSHYLLPAGLRDLPTPAAVLLTPYRRPRSSEATAAIRQAAMAKSKAMSRPWWKGAAIRDGKNVCPVR